MSGERPSVSVVVPVLDEAAHIDAVAASVTAQDYDGEIEFIFVDNGSTDGTRQRLAEIAAADQRVRVVDNPQRGIAKTLNVGLAAATGEVFVRMDAHSHYADDYVTIGVNLLAGGAADWFAGPALARGDGRWSRWTATALSSPLGVGGADFRRSTEMMPSDTAFGGVIRRANLLALGGWDERWVVNEDAELATRALAAGLRIMLVPGMAADYVPRDDPAALARQYWRYGVWRARTSVEHPQSMRPSHVLPPAVVIALVLALKLLPARLAVLAWALVLAGESARRCSGSAAGFLKLFASFAIMHLAWGAGNIFGFARFGSPLPALRQVAQRFSSRVRT